MQTLTRSLENLARAKRTLSLGVSSGLRASAQPTPLYFDRGYGARFRDVDNNEFIDHCLAWGPLILGHAHPAINEAVSRQLERGYTFGAQCELEFQVAEKIVELVPCAERVLFSNTGTEAVQAALRVARAATGRKQIIKFEGHYHGWADNVLVSYAPPLTAVGSPEQPNVVPSSGGQLASAYGETVVLPWNDEQSVANYLSAHGNDIAAIITEPVLCNNGCILPAPGYLAALRRLCDQHGIVLIFDEVITGFRVSLGGAQALFGVTPDLAVFGKAIAGGFTFSAIAGKESIIRAVDEGKAVHAGTFNGNPIVLAAALATMNELATNDGGVLKAAQQYGETVMSELQRLSAEHQVPLQVSGVGAVFRPIFGVNEPPRNYRDYAQADKQRATAFTVELFKRGVYTVPEGRWYVSGVHGNSELQQVLAALPKAMQAIAEAQA